jgi:hypothetical protein
MSREDDDRGLSTADLVAAGDRRAEPMHERMSESESGASLERARVADAAREHDEPLAALFQPDAAQDFRSRWDAVQIGFVDDPRRAVQQADELVAQVMRSLAESFSEQRAQIEGELGQGEQGSTEAMRVALRRYRSFFQRLLSL